MKKILLLLMIFGQFLLAQNPTATLELENGRVEGGMYKFDVSITRTSSWGANFLSDYLGSSSSRFTYNSAALGAPTIDATGPFFNSGDHSVSGTVLTGQINVETNFTFNGNDSKLVMSQKYLLFTVALPITDAGQNAGIQWVPVSTAYFQGDDENIDATLIGNLEAAPLPVELKSFNATNQKGNSVNLQWETATEVNNYGFEVERSLVVEADEDVVWEKISFVEGSGNSNSSKAYSFEDKNPIGGTKFNYRLKQIDIDGTFEYSDMVEIEVLPAEYELFQNYPNPFNPSTKIKFSLPEDAKVAVDIYNMLGQRVMTLFNKNMKAGYHQVLFDTQTAGHQLASGVYIYTISTKNFSSVKKMVLLK